MMNGQPITVWNRVRAWLGSWTRPALLLGGVVALGLAGTHSYAEDDPFEDLLRRVEMLEEENRELRQIVETETTSEEESSQESAEGEVMYQSEDADEERIGSLVEEYLKNRPAESQAVDQAQEQEISALRSSLNGVLDKVNKKTLPSIQVMGVFQADAGFFDQSANSKRTYDIGDGNFGDIKDGADFRRARLGVKGALTETTNYFMQFDFAFFGRPTFTDVWVEQTKVPVLGNVRVGQWKQPFSLEVVSSFRYTTFVERSLLFQAFTPFRHLGAGFYDTNEDQTMTWAMSGFASGQDQFGGSITNRGGWGTAERVTMLPFWDDATKGESYLHLGFGHFFSAPPNRIANFRSIPELYIGQNSAGVAGTSGQAGVGNFDGTPFFVQTGNLGVYNFNVLGSEMLWVDGPLSFQSEAMVNFVNQTPGVAIGPLQTVNFDNGTSMAILKGAYGQIGYFLTGEHRPYDRKAGAIDRIIPKSNFSPVNHDDQKGWGAWEVAGRWSYLDLNDKNVRGGTINDLTAGLNWYLNPYWKMQFNYIHSMPNYTRQHPPAGTPDSPYSRSTTNMFDLRCQMDF